MNPLRVVAAVALLALSGILDTALAQEPSRNGYLRAVYSWRIPMVPNCGTPEAFSTKVPFTIQGKTIQGTKTIGNYNEVINALPLREDPEDPDLRDVFVMPEDPAQVIYYEYRCGSCNVSGTVMIHGVKGKVRTYRGKEMLHFFVTYSHPTCKVDCFNFDCSDDERVVDEFMTPVEDGYVVDRPENMIFKYLLRLE